MGRSMSANAKAHRPPPGANAGSESNIRTPLRIGTPGRGGGSVERMVGLSLTVCLQDLDDPNLLHGMVTPLCHR